MSAPVMNWSERQADARSRFRRCAGARRSDFTESLSKAVDRLSRHGFASRTADGLFGVAEVWCNNTGVIFDRRNMALELIRSGYRVAALPTAFSTRAVGQRQPYVIVPSGSNVDPRQIYAALVAAKFEGVSDHEP
jgi:hypothetical protein